MRPILSLLLALMLMLSCVGCMGTQQPPAGTQSTREEEGVFTQVLEGAQEEAGIDLQGACVIPGLVDIHNHGNSGADFSDGDYAGLLAMARYLARNGITSFAPASMTLMRCWKRPSPPAQG